MSYNGQVRYMAETSAGQIGLDLVVNKNGFDKQMAGIQGLAKKAGIALAAAFGVKKLVSFGKQCIELGSDLNEVQNVVDVTFTSMSDKVDKFAKNAASSFGLSETMAKKYTGTFGAMAKSFGFSEKAAYDMSTTLTGLAGDIASFYNISQDEAYTKLKSVFTGETETLKELGVVMTQNALDAYAMANGYGKTTKSMTEAEKVALRYAFVQSKLNAAAGDFSRTSGSWANQVRVLTLQFESLKATIGQGLINVFTPVIRVVNILIGRLVTLAESFKNLTSYFSSGNNSNTEKSAKKTTDKVKNLANSFSSANSAASSMGSSGQKAMSKVGKAAEKAAKKMRTLMGFDQINKLNDNETEKTKTGGSGGSGGSSVAGAVDMSGTEDAASSTSNNSGKLKPLPKIYENLAKSIGRFKKACSELAGVIQSGLNWAYENVLKPLGKWTISKLAPKILDVFSGAIRVVTSVLKVFAPFAKLLFENFLKPIAKFTGGIIIKFLDLLAKALNKVADFINKHQKKISDFIPVIASLFAAFKVGNFIKDVVVNFETFSGVVKGLFGKSIFGKGAGLVKKLVTAFLGLPAPVKIAVAVFAALVAAGIAIYKNWDKIKAGLKTLEKFFKKVWANIKNQVKKAVDKIMEYVEKIKNIPKDLKKLFKNKIEGVEEWFSGIKDGFVDTLKNLKDSVPDMSDIKDAILEKIGKFGEMTLEFAAKIVTSFKDLVSGFVGKAIDFGAKIATSLKDLISAFVGKVIEFGGKIGTSLKDLISGFVGKSIEFAAKITTTLATLIAGFVGKVINFIASIGSFRNNIDKKRRLLAFKAKIASFVNALAKGRNKLSFKAIIYTFQNAIEKAKRVLNFKAKITSVDKDGFGGGGASFAKGGILIGNTWKKIQQYASGGLPNQGQMFIAREAGPELVGTIGGHTSVMNNDQIVSSVSSGVAQAVSSAMSKIAQSLYNAVSNLKIESRLPEIKVNATPSISASKSSQSQDYQDLKKLIELMTANSNENKSMMDLLRTLITIVSGIDPDVKLDGKSIKDNVVRRINNNTRATGKCEIIM